MPLIFFPILSAITWRYLASEPALDYFRIALTQRSDPELDQLRLGNLDSNMSFQLVQVALADHDISLLCDKSYSRLRPIIPKALRPDIFRIIHGLILAPKLASNWSASASFGPG